MRHVQLQLERPMGLTKAPNIVRKIRKKKKPNLVAKWGKVLDRGLLWCVKVVGALPVKESC